MLVVAIFFLAGSGGGEGENGETSLFGGLFPSIEDSDSPGTLRPEIPGEETALPPGEKPPAEILTSLPLSANIIANLPQGSMLLLADAAISSFATVASTTRYHKNIAENLGHVFERNLDGTNEEKRISNLTIPQVLKVSWAPDSMKAVVFYNMEGQVKKLLIDYEQKEASLPETQFLPDSITAVAFSPDSKSMAFINDLGNSNNVFIATANFEKPRKLLDNNVPGFEISWPSFDLIALKTRSSYAITSFLYTVNTRTGALAKIAEGGGLDAIWSVKATKVLYSSSDRNGSLKNLTLYDLTSEESKNINIKTIAEKCGFSNEGNTIYCGVPKTLAIAKYPDEWWQGKVSMEDHIVKIDLENNEISTLVSTAAEIIMPRLSDNDSYLLFKDKKTNYLWSVKLK